MVKQKLAPAAIGDPEGVLELLWLLAATVLDSVRTRDDLVLESHVPRPVRSGRGRC